MINSKVILIISGILVIIGILISYSQSENEINSLATSQQTLPASSSMNVSKILDPAVSKDGVYSIQISDFNGSDTLNVSVIGPAGSTLVSKPITKNPVQENFTVSDNGTYELKIQNTAPTELDVTAIIGYYPHGPSLLDLICIIILIVGLSGLAIGMLYFIKSRGKK